MHEWALGEAIVSELVERSKHKNITEKVEIAFGELNQIDREALLFVIKQMAKGTNLENLDYSVVQTETSFFCNACGHHWRFADVKCYLARELGEDNPVHFIPDIIQVFVRCLKCGSQDFQTTDGNITIRFLNKGEGE
jgi:hydrogenase nickel incorporation protein HypA/HybF